MRLERVDNLGAYRIPPETGILIPSDFDSYHGKCMAETVEIFIRLLHEGTECSRPTEALDLGNGLFKVLPTPNYDLGDEVWEFPPDSIVRTELRRSEGKEFRIAVAPYLILGANASLRQIIPQRETSVAFVTLELQLWTGSVDKAEQPSGWSIIDAAIVVDCEPTVGLAA